MHRKRKIVKSTQLDITSANPVAVIIFYLHETKSKHITASGSLQISGKASP